MQVEIHSLGRRVGVYVVFIDGKARNVEMSLLNRSMIMITSTIQSILSLMKLFEGLLDPEDQGTILSGSPVSMSMELIVLILSSIEYSTISSKVASMITSYKIS